MNFWRNIPQALLVIAAMFWVGTGFAQPPLSSMSFTQSGGAYCQGEFNYPDCEAIMYTPAACQDTTNTSTSSDLTSLEAAVESQLAACAPALNSGMQTYYQQFSAYQSPGCTTTELPTPITIPSFGPPGTNNLANGATEISASVGVNGQILGDIYCNGVLDDNSPYFLASATLSGIVIIWTCPAGTVAAMPMYTCNPATGDNYYYLIGPNGLLPFQFACDSSASAQGCAQTPEPINPLNGNESITDPDDYRSADGLLRYTRTYNSASPQTGVIGPAWTDNFLSRQLAPTISLTTLLPAGTISGVYADPQTACVQGWLDIAGNQANSAGITASWNGSACMLSNGQKLPIMSTTPLSTQFTNQDTAYPLTAFRPNGSAYTFTCQTVNCPSTPGVALQLTTNTTNTNQVLTTTYSLTNEDGSTETYSANGQWQSTTYPGGYTQTASYANGQLTAITDSFGRTLGFSYNASGLLASLTTPDGITQYGYDPTGRLISVTHPDGTTRQYQYGNPQFPVALTTVVDENGATFASISYDNAGRALQSGFANGVLASSVDYTIPLAPVVTDAFGVSRTYQYVLVNGSEKLSSVSGQSCNTCNVAAANVYDGYGYYFSQSDWNGNITQHFYEASGLEDIRIQAADTPQQRTTRTTWNEEFRRPIEVDQPGRSTSYEYDEVGNVTSQSTTDTNSGAVRTTTYPSYTQFGQPLQIVGPRTDVSQVTQFSYYPIVPGDPRSGMLYQITDALGHVTTFNNYNASGHPTQATDPNGLVMSLSYDTRGRLTATQKSGELTQYFYDGVGQLIQATQPNGSYLKYNYNAAHQLVGVQDQLGNKIIFSPDAMGNNTAEQIYNASGVLVQTHSRLYNSFNQLIEDIGAQNQVTAYTNDNNGNQTSVTNPLGQQTSKTYDSLNRLITVADPNNGLTQYTYTALDQISAVADPRELVTTYVNDAFGDRPITASPDSGTTTEVFDGAGNVTSSTDAKSQTTLLQYDALNRVTQITRADQSVVSFSYDQGVNGIGHLTGMTDSSGSTSWLYDQIGHIMSKTSIVGSATLATAYAYDSAGRIASMTLPSGRTVGYTWANGQIVGLTLKSKTTTSPLVSNITYQPFGGPVSWTLGNGEVAHRVYDQDGRITSDPIETIAYNIGSEVTSRTLGGASVFSDTQTFGYDNLQRLTSYSGVGGTISYVYDPSGNRTQKIDNGTPTNYAIDPGSNRILSQDHKALNAAANMAVAELIVVGTPAVTISVTPEAVELGQSATLTWSSTGATSCTASGNWSGAEALSGSQIVTPAATGDYTYTLTCTGGEGSTSNSAVLSVSSIPKGSTLYSYDGNGSVMSDGVFQYGYDAGGRLITAESTPAGATTPSVYSTYAFNGLDQRVQMNTSSGVITLVYDELGHLLGHYNAGTNGPETVWLGDMPIAVVKTSATYYIHADYLNTPRQIDNASGQAVWTWEPVTFGANAPNADPLNTGTSFDYKLRFPGQIADTEPGLRYNYMRDYNPTLGRYVQSDPIGLIGGVNTYVYVGENPISSQDRNGLCPNSTNCQALANSLGLSASLLATSSTSPTPIDDSWAISNGVTFAGATTMAVGNAVMRGGSKSIGGRSVGATMSEIKVGGNIMGGAGVLISGYQAYSAYQSGDPAGAVVSSADAGVGIAAFIPGFDIPAVGYFIARLFGDVTNAATTPAPLLERLMTYQDAGCL